MTITLVEFSNRVVEESEILDRNSIEFGIEDLSSMR